MPNTENTKIGEAFFAYEKPHSVTQRSTSSIDRTATTMFPEKIYDPSRNPPKRAAKNRSESAIHILSTIRSTDKAKRAPTTSATSSRRFFSHRTTYASIPPDKTRENGHRNIKPPELDSAVSTMPLKTLPAKRNTMSKTMQDVPSLKDESPRSSQQATRGKGANFHVTPTAAGASAAMR